MSSTDSAPRTLADDLRARTDHELAALLRARPDLVVPVPADIAQLASRAATRASLIRALDRLDRFTLQVVDALAVLPDPATPAGVQHALGASKEQVENAISVLHQQAVVWGSDRGLHLVRAVHDVIGPHPAGLGPPAREPLLSLPPARLSVILAELGLAQSGDHAAHATTVAAHHGDPARLDTLLAELGDDVFPALRALAAGPPTGRVANARRDVTRATARTPVDLLLATGLLIPVGEETVVLPREVGMHLRAGVVHTGLAPQPPVPETTAHEPGSVDRAAAAAAFDLVRKVETLLNRWGVEPPAVLRSGGLGVRDHRRLPELLNTDLPGAALVAELAFAAGLVAPNSDPDEVWLPTPAYDTWRRADVATRWAELVHSWRTMSRAAGLVGSRDDRNRPMPPLGRDVDRPLAAEVRRLVLDVLSELPAGTAPDVDGVLEGVRWRRPRRGGQLRDDLVRWTVREAEAIGITGRGALASFAMALSKGRIEEKAETAEAIRPFLPEPLDHLLLQADLTAVVPGPLRADLAHELDLLAEVESRGGASVHRFTAESLRRALDAGRSAVDIHDFLATVSRTPVPQPLTYLVDDVARKYGRLRVGKASAFVRCDDESVLVEITTDARSAALRLRRIAPTVLASSLDGDTLLDRLRRLGFAAVPEGVDGSIILTHRVPRRTPSRPAPQPVRTEHPIPDEPLLGAAVRALRAGDRSSESRPVGAAPVQLGRTASAQMLADLRAALTDASTVWIGYVDHHGGTSERVVDPVRLEGGWLTAFDHRSGEVRSFAAHRISGVAPVEA